MSQYEVWLNTDLNQLPRVEKVGGFTFTGDSLSVKLGAIVTQGGSAVTLTGDVTGYVIRPDGVTVVITGDKITNKAWVELPESAFSVAGMCSFALRVTYGADDSNKIVIAAASFMVRNTSTNTVIDPGSVVPTYDELVEAIEALQTDMSETQSALAIVESGNAASQTISSGSYVLWNGSLYTADVSIPSGTAFETSGGNKNLTSVPNGGLNALNNKIDNPKNIYRYTLSANTQKTFTISNNARLMMTTFDSTANRCGMWFIISTGAGAVSQKEIVAASDITINTATTNKLKVTSPGTSTVIFEELRGNDISAYVS